MFRKALLGLAGCLLTAGLALGELKTVVCKDGKRWTGEVTKTEKGYRIEMKSGIVMEVPAADVKAVEDVVTPEQEYQARLAKIDAKDPVARCRLGEWAMAQGLLEIAQKELQAALELKKDYEKAALLLRQVEAGIKAAADAKPPETGEAGREPGGTGRAAAGVVEKEWLVTENDIYRIRQAELSLTDQVSVKFRNDVVDRFLKASKGRGDFQKQGAADEFRGLPLLRQAQYMLLNGNPRIDRDDYAMKDDILITKDPRSIAEFRSKVWPIVAGSCGVSRCHGGEKLNGGFRLLNIAARNEAVDYTNFLILDGFVKGGRRMVNRDRNEDSLLLQAGLPGDLSTFKHPKSIAPVFSSRTAQNYTMVLDWIKTVRTGPAAHPDYRLQWTPPFGMKLDFGGVPSFDAPGPANTKPAAGDSF